MADVDPEMMGVLESLLRGGVIRRFQEQEIPKVSENCRIDGQAGKSSNSDALIQLNDRASRDVI